MINTYINILITLCITNVISNNNTINYNTLKYNTITILRQLSKFTINTTN